MIDAFVSLFTNASALFFILFALALILLIAEAVVPSFGLLGLGGILLAFGSIVTRCVEGNNTSKEILLYIVYIVVIYLLFIVIAKVISRAHRIITAKKRYTIIDGVKVPLTAEGNPDYSFLLGKEGVVVADLKPLGKIKIGNDVFEATTSKGYIYSGAIVKVDKVIAQRIIVKRKG